jgi:hypothetical protein
MLKERAANTNQATTNSCLAIKQVVVVARKGLAILKSNPSFS